METIGFILSVIVGLFILVALVALHELGHAIIARRNGVVVEEFGVGFPPQAWSKKVPKSFLGKDVIFSVNWLPLGGFVKLQGENDAASKKGDFGAAAFWPKTKIVLAGVTTNWLIAAVLFTILMLVGMPKVLPQQVYMANDTVVTSYPLRAGTVVKNSPAQTAGLKVGDIITSIDGDSERANAITAPSYTKAHAGQKITITYTRDGQSTTTTATLNTADKAADGYLGVGFDQKPTIYRSTWSAPFTGLALTAQLSIETVKGLGDIVGKLAGGLAGIVNPDASTRQQASTQLNKAGDGVVGPIGIVGTILPGAVSAGIVPVMFISAVISLTLAVMNVLPIPALDGGRWYLMALFRIIRKPLTRELEEKINSIGMLILLALIVLVTITDVTKLF